MHLVKKATEANRTNDTVMINQEKVFVSARVQMVLSYLEANYKNKVTVSLASNLAGLSIFHFERVFKREVGLPFKKYVTFLKMVKAAETLRFNMNIHITDLCFDFGYSDLSKFYKIV